MQCIIIMIFWAKRNDGAVFRCYVGLGHTASYFDIWHFRFWDGWHLAFAILGLLAFGI